MKEKKLSLKKIKKDIERIERQNISFSHYCKGPGQ